ncbi:MAG: hypothetical protein EOP05_13970 [Proteobacteria bacterium]|nr:MAG: hypothetical protein EOP05_13970 [Pseudomonadota bacterium]
MDMEVCLMGVSKLALGLFAAQFAFSGLSISSASAASLVDGVEATEGSLEYVVCSAAGKLNVRNEALNQVVFTVVRGDRALPVQSFGTDSQTKVIDGVSYEFIKLQFPTKPASNNIGWVAKSYLTLKSQCPGLEETVATPTPVATPAPASASWVFPTIKRPSESYRSGMRAYKASRSGGRLHAAADLYRLKDEAVRAVTSGTVVRDRYYFYEGTYAIEVAHTGGRIVRYGEITGKAAANVAATKKVSTNQTLGYIGKVNSGCCTPMLHFEMYSGSGKGALTQSGNSFSRRSDLMNPTTYLQTWEKASFGVSY